MTIFDVLWGLMTLLAVSLLRLWWTGKLVLYINPVTTWLVVGCVLMLLGMSIWATLRPRLQAHTHLSENQLLVVSLLALGLAVMPNVPLSAAIAEQRQSGGSTVVSHTFVPHRDPSTFSLLEWLSAWESDPTHTLYKGERAQVSGFIMRDGAHAYVTRMLISCCAVDAQPIQLELAPNPDIPATGTWVSVSGVVQAQGDAPQLVAKTITEIKEPANPYVN
jgi:uncharacterized repeat protein (TIGR03943 family)